MRFSGKNKFPFRVENMQDLKVDMWALIFA